MHGQGNRDRRPRALAPDGRAAQGVGALGTRQPPRLRAQRDGVAGAGRGRAQPHPGHRGAHRRRSSRRPTALHGPRPTGRRCARGRPAHARRRSPSRPAGLRRAWKLLVRAVHARLAQPTAALATAAAGDAFATLRQAASGPRALGGSAPASWTRWQRRAARGRDAPHRRGRGAGPRTVARPSPWRRPAGPVPWSAGRWPWTARPPPEHRPLPMSGRGRGAARVPGRYSGPTRTGTRVAPAHAGPGFTATATRPRSWRASAAAFWPRATAALCSPPSNQVYRLSGQRPVIDATRWRFGQSAGAGGA